MTSLISPEQTFPLLAFVGVGAASSIWLEQNKRWAAGLGGPVVALVLAMVLSNVGVIPTQAPAYDVVDDYLVPVAIPLLLFRAHLGRIFRETGPLLATFHVAAVGSMVGAFLAAALFRGAFEQVPELAGIMAASYIGGAVNFVALRDTYSVPASLTNPLLVADNFIMSAMFAALLVMAGSRWMRQRYPHPHSSAGDATDSRELAARHWRRKEISLLDLAAGLGLALAITATAMTLTAWVKQAVPSVILRSLVGNPFLLITGLTVLVTTLGHRWVERIQGAEDVGMYLLYLFFFVIGVRADLVEVVRNVPVLFLFCLVMALTNLVFTLGVGRMLRMNLEELLLAVNATLGGAPSAAAMAIARGWSALVLPGLLAGLWGYVIGTFLGLVTTEVLRRVF